MRSTVESRTPLLGLGLKGAFVAFLSAFAMFLFAGDARAAGSFKLKNSEVQEVSGAWHLYVTLELPKAPLTAHQPMRFSFVKTAVFERTLMDGHADPVPTRQPVNDTTASVEALDVDFADASGKIYKKTIFDFGLTRTRGFEAGEYTVEVRTADGTQIGSKTRLVLKGDNPVVDRRSIAFDAKKPIKKVEGVDAGAQPKNDDQPAAADPGNGEVQATGTAEPFIPKEGYEETDEEKIKTRPKGCGCEVPGHGSSGALTWGAPLVVIGLGALVARRRRAAS